MEKHIKALAKLYDVSTEFILNFNSENIINSPTDTNVDISQNLFREMKEIEQKLDKLISLISLENKQIS